MLRTGTTDTRVNQEFMLFQEKLFNTEFLLSLFCALSGVHCDSWANASFMHFCWHPHTLSLSVPFCSLPPGIRLIWNYYVFISASSKFLKEWIWVTGHWFICFRFKYVSKWNQDFGGKKLKSFIQKCQNEMPQIMNSFFV